MNSLLAQVDALREAHREGYCASAAKRTLQVIERTNPLAGCAKPICRALPKCAAN